MARNDASKYREFYVHGTAAYNRQVAPSEIVRDEPIYVPPRKRIEETVAANTQALTKQSLSPMVMLGFVIAVAMLVFCLIARIEFTTVSAEAAELQSQLNQLTEDNSRLTIKYESALNLAEVEDYAVNTLGMQRPTTAAGSGCCQYCRDELTTTTGAEHVEQSERTKIREGTY